MYIYTEREIPQTWCDPGFCKTLVVWKLKYRLVQNFICRILCSSKPVLLQWDHWWGINQIAHQKGIRLKANKHKTLTRSIDIILCFQLGLIMLRKSNRPLSSCLMSIHLKQLYVHCKYSDFKLWRNSGTRYRAEICRTKALFRTLLTSPWTVLTLC